MNNFVDFVSAIGLLNFAGERFQPTPYFAGQTDISFAQETAPEPIKQSALAQVRGKLGVIYDAEVALLRMLNLATYVGIQSEVLIIDGGNCFDLHYVAYAIRRFTPWWEEVASRTHIVRAFTCYEALKALQEIPPNSSPLLAIDLLATFYDESVNDAESFRLAKKCAEELKRISSDTPAIVSLSPPPLDFKARRGLNKLIEKAADHVFIEERIASPVYQPALF